MPVCQVAGTWTARYQAVPLKIDRRRSISAVGGRLKGDIDRRRSIEGEINRQRSIEREKGKKKRKKRKKEKRRRRIPSTRAPSPLEGRGAFSPVRERTRRCRLGD
ncbi:hypothetical protein BHM03_00048187, partial [Ensete ventricosum]